MNRYLTYPTKKGSTIQRCLTGLLLMVGALVALPLMAAVTDSMELAVKLPVIFMVAAFMLMALESEKVLSPASRFGNSLVVLVVAGGVLSMVWGTVNITMSYDWAAKSGAIYLMCVAFAALLLSGIATACYLAGAMQKGGGCLDCVERAVSRHYMMVWLPVMGAGYALLVGTAGADLTSVLPVHTVEARVTSDFLSVAYMATMVVMLLSAVWFLHFNKPDTMRMIALMRAYDASRT